MTVATLAEWTPSPDDVAALIPTRTGDATGLALGAWSEATVPTIAQVHEAINGVVAEVNGAVGDIPRAGTVEPDPVVELAKRCVALGAASFVELTFYPDQGFAARAAGDVLFERYQLALKALKSAVDRINNGQSLSGLDSAAPTYSFPDRLDIPTPPITTYGERF